MTDVNLSGITDEYVRGAMHNLQQRIDVLEAGGGGLTTDSVTSSHLLTHSIDPETDVSIVQTDGTGNPQTVTLALPSTKVTPGRKKVILVTSVGGADALTLSSTFNTRYSDGSDFVINIGEARTLHFELEYLAADPSHSGGPSWSIVRGAASFLIGGAGAECYDSDIDMFGTSALHMHGGVLNLAADEDHLSRLIAGDNVNLALLPTVDPAENGRLWNNAGTLKISAG